MAVYGGSNNAPGPQGYGFMPTGPTQPIALGATSVTVTLSQFVGTAPYARQVAFCAIGAAAGNSVSFVAFGSTTVTVSSTNGVPIVPIGLKPAGGNPFGGYEVLTTGKSPQQYMAIGSAGTVTVYVTPGEGSR